MSALIDPIHDSTCPPDCECTAQNISPLSIHGDPRQAEIWRLMLVTVGQREEADIKDNGWHSVWCLDCEQCSEPFQGKLESFAEQLAELGWSVLSLDHNTAICKTCANREFEPTEEQEREDFKVYEATS